MAAVTRDLSRLLRAPHVDGWWRLAAVLVCEQAAEVANRRNDRALWELIDAVYAHGDPWDWTDDAYEVCS